MIGNMRHESKTLLIKTAFRQIEEVDKMLYLALYSYSAAGSGYTRINLVNS